jgi:DNA-binding PadR family transcriptional regulator
MNEITTLLLCELQPLPLSQNALRQRLASWGYEVTPTEITENLRALEADGLISGVSVLDHLPVNITARGQQVARELGDDRGAWRRVA